MIVIVLVVLILLPLGMSQKYRKIGQKVSKSEKVYQILYPFFSYRNNTTVEY